MTQAPARIRTFDALDAFFGGIGFVMSTPSVWPWAAVPAALMMLFMCGGGALGIWGVKELLDAWLGENLGTWGTVGYWALMIPMAGIALLIATLIGLLLAQPLAGFALEKIVQAQERKLTGRARPSLSFFGSLWLNLRTVAFAVVLGGIALTVLFVIDLAVPPAVVVTVPLKFLVCGWMIAWDLVDYPLGLRGLGIGQRLDWVFRNFGAFTLYGVLWAGLCVVPGIFLLLLPMGVAGAARLVLQDDPGRDERMSAREP